MPLLNKTYHHEIHNKFIETAFGQLNAYDHQVENERFIDKDKMVVYVENWAKYALLHQIRSIVEYKFDANTLNYKTYLNILRSDFKSCGDDKGMRFLAGGFYKYIDRILACER